MTSSSGRCDHFDPVLGSSPPGVKIELVSHLEVAVRLVWNYFEIWDIFKTNEQYGLVSLAGLSMT
jgi:hypothetical protein